MSTIKLSDYLAWTQKNFPSLTVPEQSLLSRRLLEAHPSTAFLVEITAIPVQSRAAILAVLSLIKASWQAAGLSTVNDTQGVYIAKTKLPVRDKD